MNCNTTHYRANSSSVPGDPTCWAAGVLATHPALAENELAAKWVPFDQLTPTNAALAHAVTDNVTLEREYAARRFTGDARCFAWLMDDMIACSTLAEHVGLIQYRATRDEQGRIWADNQAGARGYLVPLHATTTQRVFYVSGVREGVFDARGRGVTVLNFREPEPNVIEYTAVTFVKVDNVVLATLAKMFRIFLTSTVDENFAHVLRQPTRLSESAVREPQRLRAVIAEMPEADRALLREFLRLLPASR